MSASLSWELSEGVKVIGFNISYYDGKCHTINNTVSVDNTTKNHTMTNLQDGTHYLVMLMAIQGQHVIGYNKIHVVTRSSGELLMRCLMLTLCQSLVPSAAPSSVSVSKVTSSSITVQWEEVPCTEQNGNITGYIVQYHEMGSDTKQSMLVSGAERSGATISSLMSDTSYVIQVAAINTVGTGTFSKEIHRRTGKNYILLAELRK